MATKVFRITTPGFVAAMIVRDGVVVQGAPILRRYVGLPWVKVKEQLRRLYKGQREYDLTCVSGGMDYDDE